MAKKNVFDEFVIEVRGNFRRSFWAQSEQNQKRFIETIREQIDRHVDDAICDVKRLSHYVCEHCGYDWGTKSSTYNGGCCEKDEENNPNSRKQVPVGMGEENLGGCK